MVLEKGLGDEWPPDPQECGKTRNGNGREDDTMKAREELPYFSRGGLESFLSSFASFLPD